MASFVWEMSPNLYAGTQTATKRERNCPGRHRAHGIFHIFFLLHLFLYFMISFNVDSVLHIICMVPPFYHLLSSICEMLWAKPREAWHFCRISAGKKMTQRATGVCSPEGKGGASSSKRGSMRQWAADIRSCCFCRFLCANPEIPPGSPVRELDVFIDLLPSHLFCFSISPAKITCIMHQLPTDSKGQAAGLDALLYHCKLHEARKKRDL